MRKEWERVGRVVEGLIRECQNQGPIGHSGKYPDLIEIGASCKEVREGGYK